MCNLHDEYVLRKVRSKFFTQQNVHVIDEGVFSIVTFLQINLDEGFLVFLSAIIMLISFQRREAIKVFEENSFIMTLI